MVVGSGEPVHPREGGRLHPEWPGKDEHGQRGEAKGTRSWPGHPRGRNRTGGIRGELRHPEPSNRSLRLALELPLGDKLVPDPGRKPGRRVIPATFDCLLPPRLRPDSSSSRASLSRFLNAL